MICKSQTYLKNNFFREFLPHIQDILRLRYNEEVVKMLDNYELKEVAWKEKRSQFLFKQNNLARDTQKDHDEVRDNMYLQHMIMSKHLNQE